jgi:hypothetical protein
MKRLPAAEMHHGFATAWFALCCLAYDITHHRKVRP